MVSGQARSRGPVAAVPAAEVTACTLKPLVAPDTDRSVIAFVVLLSSAAPWAGAPAQSEGGGALTGILLADVQHLLNHHGSDGSA
jgi:hypothetical protein